MQFYAETSRDAKARLACKTMVMVWVR